uniref:hypothetical protein n=1 Tax=uncultured Phocaeicola sp. TaxID=990718 RepID=UPI00262C537B
VGFKKLHGGAIKFLIRRLGCLDIRIKTAWKPDGHSYNSLHILIIRQIKEPPRLSENLIFRHIFSPFLSSMSLKTE